MRKLICSIILVGGLLAGFNAKSDKPAPEVAPAIQATWELVSAKVSCMPNEPGDFPKERRKIKIINGSQFVWIDYERATGKVLSMAGGTCELAGVQYKEKIVFASKDLETIIGQTFTFQVKVEADRLSQTGTISEGVELSEVWRKSTSTDTKAPATQPSIAASSSTSSR